MRPSTKNLVLNRRKDAEGMKMSLAKAARLSLLLSAFDVIALPPVMVTGLKGIFAVMFTLERRQHATLLVYSACSVLEGH